MLLALATTLAHAAACDDACNMLALNIPVRVVARTLAEGGRAELAASCPAVARLLDRPRRASREGVCAPPPAPLDRYRPLPRWVRPDLEVVPASSAD